MLDPEMIGLVADYEAARLSEDRPEYHRAHRELATTLKARGSVVIGGWRYAVDPGGDVWRTKASWDDSRRPRSKSRAS